MAKDRLVPGKSSWLLAWTLLCLVACRGTEHAVFQALSPRDPVVVLPPHEPRTFEQDAGTDLGKVRRFKPPSTDDDAGSAPDPGLDPTVVFRWKESLPGQGTCRTGRYVGRFSCSVDGGDMVDTPAQFFGAVSFTLTGSPEEPILTIAPGQISGPLFFASGLRGTLDCVKKRFQAMTLGGVALIGDGAAGDGAGVPTLFPTFEATFDGQFDDQSLVIAGSFVIINEAKQTCSGTFRASAAP